MAIDEVNLSEEDIEFMEAFYNPTAMTECLIPRDYDRPQLWPNGNCVVTRDYQFAMQNYSYLIADDPRLEIQDYINLKKCAGDLNTISCRNSGKCESYENECQLADGSLKKFKDLINTSQSVISFNDTTLKFEVDIAHFKDNGVKSCYKIITKSGKEITVTNNHPLYTNKGWINADNLKKDLMIATPRILNLYNTKNVDENLSKLIGYLLGDGGCTAVNIGITNINPEIVSEIYEIADYFNCNVRNNDITYYFTKKKNYTGRKNDKCDVTKITEKFDLRKLAKHKEIHPDIFNWSNKNIAILLNRLFACDGYYNSEDNWTIFEITLASKKLVYQIQSLLLRFGIHSSIFYKKAKCEDKYFDSWRLYIDKDVDILLKEIGTFTKDNLIKKETLYQTSDLIPKNLINNYKWELEGRDRTKLRNDRKYGISRNKLKSIVNDWYHPNLYKLANSDIYWEAIESVEYVGKLPTVMVSVDKNHTYISNNIISHNSFYLKIDVVLSYIHSIGQICLASFDDYHLKKIATPIADFLEHHKFLQIFSLKNSRKESVQRTPLSAKSEHGCTIESANENIKGNNPGEQFHSKHWDYLTYEEFSYASDEGTKKRISAGNIDGYIFRPSGIPDLCVGSPLGKMLSDPKLKNFIWQCPLMVYDGWSKTMEKELMEQYGGETTYNYKLNVLAETIPGAFGYFDIDRVIDNSFKKNGVVKFIEIGKENFDDFQNLLHVEKLHGSESCYICADLGFGAAPTEIIIIFFDGKKYKYEYNIRLNRLSPEEQPEIIYALYNLVEGAFIALDSTSDSGAMIERLAKMGIPREHLMAVNFNSNIEIGFEKDENGNIKVDGNNDPIMKIQRTDQFSYPELARLLYSGEVEIPNNLKLQTQLTKTMCKKGPTGVPKYGAKGENHLVQSWQVFAICRFINKFNILKQKLKPQKRAYCSK